ncbi:hypothetical protein [Aestuariirhabdus litorea]|uniref:hypothetical protein n=1 Tax=Aestuariirhabdus litorea TaxID=2528527 RepID=UPI000F620CC1|nr:hypothetical protein [Aestuariirhabdus litorea]RWW97117.1 hypothetical protein DZC74_01890 [Endozoicomonadaceae bacterium GTF-13]
MSDTGLSKSQTTDFLINTIPEISKTEISIRWTPNTGPYRKLIPMLRQASPEDIFVTADDDIFYGKDWLLHLTKTYNESGGKPVACRVRSINKNLFGVTASYLHWKLIEKPITVDRDYIITFGGGAVLTRQMFKESDIYNDAYLELAPTSDDLWYSKLLQNNNNEIVVIPSLLEQLYFINHNDGLENINWPTTQTFSNKVKRYLWSNIAGAAGFTACENDIAYRKIHSYFSNQNKETPCK